MPGSKAQKKSKRGKVKERQKGKTEGFSAGDTN